MTLISALSQFGMDLSDAAATASFAQRLPVCPDSRLEIDLSGCILDYPATSALVNGALERVCDSPSPRTVLLRFDIPFQERVFQKWLFFGSNLLGEGYQNLDSLALRECVTQALRRRDASLSISISDPITKQQVVEYSYG